MLFEWSIEKQLEAQSAIYSVCRIQDCKCHSFLGFDSDNDWEVSHLPQIDQAYSNCTRSSRLTWTTRKCLLRTPTVMAVFDRPSAGAKAEYAIHGGPWCWDILWHSQPMHSSIDSNSKIQTYDILWPDLLQISLKNKLLLHRNRPPTVSSESWQSGWRIQILSPCLDDFPMTHPLAIRSESYETFRPNLCTFTATSP